MSRFKLVILSLVFIFLFHCQALANICEEDAAKIAMSHCFKNFTDLYSAPGVKVRVDSVELVKLNGINGPVELYRVIIAKYHSQTLLKISDFLSYEIERTNAVITAVKNIENDNACLKKRSYELFSAGELALAGTVDYEKYACIIELYGDMILAGIKDERNAGVRNLVLANLETALAGIALYKPEVAHKTIEFEKGLKSVRLVTE